jgi:predicted lipopolysaccharide heptosyltransferase III
VKKSVRDHVYSNQIMDWSRIHRVLLIRLRSIGDTVLMTPCLAALKSFHPDIEIDVLMEPLSAPVLEDHPLVDNLIIAESSFTARARLIPRLRRRRYDVAYNLHGGSTGMIIARLSGAEHTVGFEGHRQSWMLTARAPAPDVIFDQSTIHSVEQQLALLRWSGVPVPEEVPKLMLAVSPSARANIMERVSAKGIDTNRFAIISPAAAMDSKQWRADGFAAVADHLKERWGLQSVIIAGPGQEHIANQVSEISRSRPPVISGITLKELIALASFSCAFVGNDSGPGHIAAAINRPLVVVFGSSNPDVWHPWTEAPYRIVKAAQSEHTHIATDSEASPSLPVSLITDQSVIAAVDEVLQKAESKGEAGAQKEVRIES